MRLKCYYFEKMSFNVICVVFWLKIRKKFRVGKVSEYGEGTVLKECFHILKRHLNQNGKVQNMPVVAGRLVQYQLIYLAPRLVQILSTDTEEDLNYASAMDFQVRLKSTFFFLGASATKKNTACKRTLSFDGFLQPEPLEIIQLLAF